jgi:predicted enzyme related to lactoylglutathione lyase
LSACWPPSCSSLTVEELKSRGVEFVSDVLEFPWGYVAQFQDPDGNRLQIREGR